jgi:hypothetical protein
MMELKFGLNDKLVLEEKRLRKMEEGQLWMELKLFEEYLE